MTTPQGIIECNSDDDGDDIRPNEDNPEVVKPMRPVQPIGADSDDDANDAEDKGSRK
jgi:hypothetical protein